MRVDIQRRKPYCWLWLGALSPDGYGMVRIGGRGGSTETAHRAAYRLFRGGLRDRHVVHSCGNRACINPAHLEAMPHARVLERYGAADSVTRYWARRKTCRNGHPRTKTNTYTDKHGARRCRICARQKAFRRAQRRS